MAMERRPQAELGERPCVAPPASSVPPPARPAPLRPRPHPAQRELVVQLPSPAHAAGKAKTVTMQAACATSKVRSRSAHRACGAVMHKGKRAEGGLGGGGHAMRRSRAGPSKQSATRRLHPPPHTQAVLGGQGRRGVARSQRATQRRAGAAVVRAAADTSDEVSSVSSRPSAFEYVKDLEKFHDIFAVQGVSAGWSHVLGWPHHHARQGGCPPALPPHPSPRAGPARALQLPAGDGGLCGHRRHRAEDGAERA